MKGLDEILMHNYYDDALQLLDENTQKFVETTSWAGELHQQAILSIKKQRIIAWIEKDVIGGGELLLPKVGTITNGVITERNALRTEMRERLNGAS